MKPITIRIESDDGEFPGTFTVEQDGKLNNGLCWDEMLGQIAALTIPSVAGRIRQHGGALYPMRTEEDWKALQRASEERRAQRDGPLSDDDISF